MVQLPMLLFTSPHLLGPSLLKFPAFRSRADDSRGLIRAAMLWCIAVAVFFPSLVAGWMSLNHPRVQSSFDKVLSEPSGLPPQMDAMLDCVSCEPERRFRFGYGHGPGVSVYGWPSQGGIYTLHGCMGVELDFLGYDRFDLPLDLVEPQPAEDEHCNRSKWCPILPHDFSGFALVWVWS